MVESIETLVIGAGHAGLSASYHLKQRGCEHIVLDKASRPASAWRERWDSFTFVTPNWTFLIPGGEYDGPDPEGFMTRDELIQRFDDYAEKNQLPIEYNTCVTSIQLEDHKGFLVKTEGKDYQASNVVTANGWFQVAKIPDFAKKIPGSILQIPSSKYRNPQALPPGAVLVAGSGQSGGQIAEELNESGRRVFLATGTAPHAPRRFRGKDIFHWMFDSGFADQRFEQMQMMGRPFVAPMISGKNGGHSLNLHQFAREGIILLGHARGYIDGKLILAPDLKENLGKADMAQKFITKRFNDYIEQQGIKAPEEELPMMMDGYQVHEMTSLDLETQGIKTIIWASGYRYDASIFKFPILNSNNLPDAPQGVSEKYPGLYFVGFPFLTGLRSGFVRGVAQTTAHVADRISGENRIA